MTTLHRCQWCEQDYPCDTLQEISHNKWRCDCPSFNECPGCSQHGACECCGQASATGDGHKPFYCGPCEEVWIDNYDGPPDSDAGGGVSIAELSDRAYRDRAELRRRD